jgi:hypothetical protein
LPGAIQDQELMLEPKRLGNDGTGTARSEQASQGSDEMDEKDDQIAHHRILAGREIPMNYGRNNNSPATGSDVCLGHHRVSVRYAHLTNTRSLALVDDPEANAYELLFSFSSSEEKDQFLELVRSNLDMGNDYIENDLLSPTTEEIRDARPLAIVLPQEVLNRAALIATTLCRGYTRVNRCIS